MEARPAHALSPDVNADDVEAAFTSVPPEWVAEIVDGQLHTAPRPARAHTRAATRLGRILGSSFDDDDGEPGGWVLLDEPELHLGRRPDKLVPDLAGWRRTRMPDAIGPGDAPSHYDLAPDWVCEVLSLSTERLDRGAKMRVYGRESVGNLWLLNPLSRTLEVFRLEAGRWVLLETYEGESRVRAEPFDAVELDLGRVWAR